MNWHIKTAAIITTLLTFSTPTLSADINPNTQYVGYAWIESQLATQNFTLTPDQVHQTIGHSTNMNVVDTLNGLNSNMCSSSRCALGVHAGQYHDVTGRIDICPTDVRGTTNDYDQCIAMNPWSKIWSIANDVANADNTPLAIYFIDEPELNDALQNANGEYIRYSYSSYVCTLREALNSKGLANVKIFTILHKHADIGSSNTGFQDIIKDIRYQMPSSGCTSGLNSRPDWIGFDNYTWTTASEIHTKYSQNFSGFSNVDWILVPPSTNEFNIASSDLVLKNKIQPYWDYIVTSGYWGSPVIGMMYFRLNPNITNQAQNPSWPNSRSLLRYMANRIVAN